MPINATKQPPLLTLEQVGLTFNTSNGKYLELLSDINIKVHAEDKYCIIGPNGAGKSTLVKIMLGLLIPTSGQVSCQPNLRVGYVPQKFAVPSVLPLRVSDLLAQVKQVHLQTFQRQFLYKKLALTALLPKQVSHLSGGETQRVLLARALFGQPNLLILDEPMQGLDPDSELWLYRFIDELPDFLQCAMVVVSHDLHWVMKGCRHVICLNKHICCEGQPSELLLRQEFHKLFGHQYEQPYNHQSHQCQHTPPTQPIP